ncbi:hypothetical protein [Clostridium sp. E02]|uniref:hypothetical protein n=1 Tax=Clostridium sp. E02 TaxID=2487134 RepID=UPI0019D2800C|nr:hypothetical protein [Clostridium sp. E02]
MRKLPVFILAAATVLSIAGVPMTAQAASCSNSYSNCFSSNCYGQFGNFNLSQYGCSNRNSRNCYTSGRNSSSCYGSNSYFRSWR